ncbi:MAG: hypothetical protein ABFD79_16550 [Phycisphaerales bacterium]
MHHLPKIVGRASVRLSHLSKSNGLVPLIERCVNGLYAIAADRE